LTTGKTVLVVDDDPKVASLVEDILTEEGHYQVLSVGDGLGAIEQTNHHHVDIVLMDVGLPMLSGYFFCHALRKKKNTRNIPVVMMSGTMDEAKAEKARSVGAVATMQKPFSSGELLALVEKNAL
jgi:CheY-like chemotaxis protein